jgi:hypothetical protein
MWLGGEGGESGEFRRVRCNATRNSRELMNQCERTLTMIRIGLIQIEWIDFGLQKSADRVVG